MSRCTWVPILRASRSSARSRSRLACASWASSLRIWASIWPSWAWSARSSSVNSRSPSLTLAPSSTWTCMIWLSMRGLMAIEAIACTVPTASSVRCMVLRSTWPVTTGTARGPLGRRVSAGGPIRPDRPGTSATSGFTCGQNSQPSPARMSRAAIGRERKRDMSGPTCSKMADGRCGSAPLGGAFRCATVPHGRDTLKWLTPNVDAELFYV